jgi:hypothetical protein
MHSPAFTGTLQGQKRYPSMLPTSSPPTLTSDGGAAAAPGAANAMKTGGAGKGPRVVDTDNVPRPQVMNVINVSVTDMAVLRETMILLFARTGHPLRHRPLFQFSSRSEETFNTLSLGEQVPFLRFECTVRVPFTACSSHMKQLVPSALSNVNIVDGGNANPAFMRITMNQVPANKDLCVFRMIARDASLARS